MMIKSVFINAESFFKFHETLILLLNLLSRLLFLSSFDRSLCRFLLESHEVLWELVSDFRVLLFDKDFSMQSSFDFSSSSSSSF